MIGWLLGGAWRYLAGAVAILAGLFVVRKSGADAVKARALKDAEKRSEKGRKAVADMRDTDRPAWIERMRDNDKRWR